MRSKIVTVIVAGSMAWGLVSGTVSADVLGQYDFTGNSLASSDTDTESTAGDFAIGAGLPSDVLTQFSGSGNPVGPSIYVQSAQTSGTDQATAVASDDFFAFTVTPSSGKALNLTQLSFNAGVNNESLVAHWSVRSSVDNYAATVGDEFDTGTFYMEPNSVDLSDAAFQGLQTPTTFRIYVWFNSVSNSVGRMDHVVLDGTTSVIPEPASLALIGLGCLTGFVRARRR